MALICCQEEQEILIGEWSFRGSMAMNHEMPVIDRRG